jgi:hypothetical protein
VYVRKVGERVLDFGHRGWLLDESFIFYDRKYDSLWVQATGLCISGKFQGERLATVPVTHTTWGQWRSLHPTTLVLAKPKNLVDRYRRDAYGPYYERRGTRFGLAVFIGNQQKLYPLDQLHANPVVHDQVGGEPVLVVYHAPTQTAVGLRPIVAGKPISLELAEVTADDVLLRAPGREAIWSGLTGRSRADGAAADGLAQLRTTQFVVANWPRHFPGSPIYTAPAAE